MKFTLLRLLPAIPAFALASCATMMAGSESSITITSTPSGAAVTTCTGLSAETPCTLSLPNGVDVRITAEHASHPGDVRTLESIPDLSRWYVGNLVMIGGAAGMVSDVANPAAYVHKQDVHFDFLTPVNVLEEREQARAERRRQRELSSGGTLRR